MKSKAIDTYSLIDLQMVQQLANFLIAINVKTAEELYEEVDHIADEEFCGSCESHNDYCECNKHNDYDDDGDRAYDAWKDAQLEKENETT